MPVIRTTLLEGFATREQRESLVAGLADALVDVFGEVTRPYVFSIVDEVKPGAWSISGQLADEQMIAAGAAASREFLATKLTAERVRAAYDALSEGDGAAIERYWDDDLTWLVPGASPVSGPKRGLDEFLGFMKSVRDLSGDTFRMERATVVVDGDRSVDTSRHTATRAGRPALAVDVTHELRWRDGRVVEGRAAIFGRGADDHDAFWG